MAQQPAPLPGLPLFGHGHQVGVGHHPGVGRLPGRDVDSGDGRRVLRAGLAQDDAGRAHGPSPHAPSSGSTSSGSTFSRSVISAVMKGCEMVCPYEDHDQDDDHRSAPL